MLKNTIIMAFGRLDYFWTIELQSFSFETCSFPSVSAEKMANFECHWILIDWLIDHVINVNQKNTSPALKIAENNRIFAWQYSHCLYLFPFFRSFCPHTHETRQRDNHSNTSKWNEFNVQIDDQRSKQIYSKYFAIFFFALSRATKQ